MTQRSAELQSFLDSLQSGFATSERPPEVAAVAETLFCALARPAPPIAPAPARLPVCDCLPAALAIAGTTSPALAAAFAAIEPQLRWAVRASGGRFASANWPEGHANATIVGPEHGLEGRRDVAIGVSLLAPHVRYPDHSHAPEEIYLLLTPGRFRHGVSDWFEPGAGGTLHNIPDITHAMASQAAPLLAIWCLLLTPRALH
ncbi:MAG: transcriptional regulator [Pseudomonadota bacterium]|nr:transcriptional regulator [Pseudomonadota bacterium]